MQYEKAYRKMHERNEKRFAGWSLKEFIAPIVKLVEQHHPTRMLDYGSGKGYQYLAGRYHERWGGLLPHCYDPGVRQLWEKPKGTFGGVISTDVMEHVPAQEVPGTLDELFNYVEPNGFLFLGISCRPSVKTFPGTEQDVHVTIRHPSWWGDLIDARRTVLGRKDVHVRADFDLGDPPHYEAAPLWWEAGA